MPADRPSASAQTGREEAHSLHAGDPPMKPIRTLAFLAALGLLCSVGSCVILPWGDEGGGNRGEHRDRGGDRGGGDRGGGDHREGRGLNDSVGAR